MTERVLEWTPPPHFSVQWFQSDQPEMVQSTGQAKVLQVGVWRSGRRATAPPCWTALMTDLERYLVPVVQVLEQAEQADQPESLQSMGQPKVLQLGCSRR